MSYPPFYNVHIKYTISSAYCKPDFPALFVSIAPYIYIFIAHVNLSASSVTVQVRNRRIEKDHMAKFTEECCEYMTEGYCRAGSAI